MKRILFLLVLALTLFSCGEKEQNKANLQFTLLSPADTGIPFSNNIKETDSLNYFTYPYMYMGGGVSAGDINNDGLIDLFFTANMESNRIYLNRGNFKFEDITEQANISGDGRWYTGSTMVDINNDGYLDIYVSVSGKGKNRQNALYINNGDLTFSEKAAEYNIDHNGHTTQGTFFDYDNDGDLDLYLANYPPTQFNSPSELYAFRMKNPRIEASDILFRNDGDGSFTDVTEEAGILNFGLSLSATTGDFNNDGWQDIYVSNDFDSPDYFYVNQQDGTFREVSRNALNHTSQYGMGTDVADYNNDNLLDIGQMDMTPEDNKRSKANMGSMNPALFNRMVRYGLHHQYMQNSLQLNRGVDGNGELRFSEVSRISGLATTDWSWAILFSDLDNDGWKDVFVSNGTRRDINNKDYFKKLDKKLRFNKALTSDEIENIPSEKISNYVFANNGNYTFENVTGEWGMDNKTFSNGALYADLDSDGDMDMVINNVDEPVSIYRNNNPRDHNFLKVKLEGTSENRNGLGSRVFVKSNFGDQMQELTLTRGFQSSVAPELVFGLADQELVEMVKVIWPDGKVSRMQAQKANQVLTFDYRDAQMDEGRAEPRKKLFSTLTLDKLAIDFKHTENAYDDYDKEPLLPHQTSMLGPGMAVGDVNGDGLQDFYIGGASKQAGAMLLQTDEGTFIKASDKTWALDKEAEDMDAVFFDSDGDQDLDLYVVSGGNEFADGAMELQDRLYINDGKGNFTKSKNGLPQMYTSGSRVKPADYDGDGDLDLFVGGRLTPGKYPWPAKSYLLENKGTFFEDQTENLAPDFGNLGMITDAVWTDFDANGTMDIIIVGEWTPILFYSNTTKGFINVTESTGLENTEGWWFSLAQEDFDNDGDMDYVAGNLGLNYKYQASPDEPFEVFADDFDNNGSKDIVLSYYNFGEVFPVRGRSCSSQQIPSITQKFEDYNSFASADLVDIYGKEDLDSAEIHYAAKTFASSYIENLGNGRFSLHKLPNEAQFSSVNGILAMDIDDDGFKDLVLAGNLYVSEIETPRNDASYGTYLRGDGTGKFHALPNMESGLFIGGDVKDLAFMEVDGKKFIIAAKNNDFPQFVRLVKGK
ncbi:VCBS repeat-containing protein [Muricauda sp. MAR_2010_75]|uniref:VCBS repeat-containing protein n=1 Tax=Allomuricauda sp. MAR_2010_75 TaxID=1250232 RepID=UPI0005606A27|nr:VCBS repeat-containing protein [Muricauda sp. MAR_2010_75]